jgi:hypothetical protein
MVYNNVLIQVILHGVHDLGGREELYPLIRLLRSLAVLRILITLRVHTEETLKWGITEMLHVNECAKVP